MKVLYFARFRQMIGRGQDEISVPENVSTVSALLNHLVANDAGVAAAFVDLRTVRVAVDQSHCALDASIIGAKEVAFFPPVTGG
jgi:sulfur-carrier protein